MGGIIMSTFTKVIGVALDNITKVLSVSVENAEKVLGVGPSGGDGGEVAGTFFEEEAVQPRVAALGLWRRLRRCQEIIHI